MDLNSAFTNYSLPIASDLFHKLPVIMMDQSYPLLIAGFKASTMGESRMHNNAGCFRLLMAIGLQRLVVNAIDHE